MEPNKFPSPAELPEPVEAVSPDKVAVVSPEMAHAPSSSPPPPAPPLPSSGSIIPTPIPAVPGGMPIAGAADAALIADDADLIEKEWVLKAKAIVAQTAHDPNLQTKEMGKVKAEYLKKRYNKTLKIDES